MAYGGYDYPSGAPGSAFHEWDAVSRRRLNASRTAPKASWDVPDGWGTDSRVSGTAASGPSGALESGTYGYGSSGDPMLDFIRSQSLSDAGARVRGARSAAMNSVGADPSQAAYADLAALLGGQGDAARSINAGALGYLGQQQGFAHEADMARLMAKLREDEIKRQNAGGWLGDLGQLVGSVGGAWLSPGGFWGEKG